MDIAQIKELVSQLEASKLRKLVLKKGDFELHLEKEGAPSVLAQKRVFAAEPEYHPPVALKDSPARADVPGSYVTSPMVGTFYPAPAPDQPPFVKVGDKVDENTVVCIIEAMKVMNEVKAGSSGTVAEVFLDSSEPVEFGTRLLRIV